ncbi:MAG: bifunctional phosphoglucose/phosphomannose isomerase [DPANN group archaeon]|nr:bifunctional phosphoglucose/phosphomannose isomerase [DPANN group archaeon]
MEDEIDYEELKKEFDRKDMYAVLKGLPDSYEKAMKLGKDLKIGGRPDQIIIMGMGGSAIPGSIIGCLSRSKIPIIVQRDFSIPPSLSRHSLVFVVSYSGDTEETLAMYRQAYKINETLISVSSGGKLQEICRMNKTPHILLPPYLPPRMAYTYLTLPLLIILRNLNLIEDFSQDIPDLVKNLKKKEHEELGQIFANKLHGRIPLILSSSRLSAAAYKWKINLNENADTPACVNTLPEFCHNGINGFTNANAATYCIILRDDEEERPVQKAMEATKQVLKEQGVLVAEINIRGRSRFQKLFTAIAIGDWVSYWLALRYHTDPTTTDRIDAYKTKIAPSH